MNVMTATNTRWRDVYDGARRWALIGAAAVHALLLFALPRALTDRLHEALIPAPQVFAVPGGPGTELEVVAIRPPSDEPVDETPPEPEPEEEVETIEEVVDAPEEMTTVETVLAASDGEGESDARDDGEGQPEGRLAGGGGVVSPPRPLHLVVPRVPDSVDKKKARGTAVFLLVEVLADGSVGEVRIEKGSRFAVLDTAALTAARQMRYVPAQRGGTGISQWTRAEMRF